MAEAGLCLEAMFVSVDALMFMFLQDEQDDVSYQPLVLVSLRQCLCESEVETVRLTLMKR